MLVKDIIVEDAIDGMLEDEAEGRGDFQLISILEFLRNRSHDIHVQPRIRADSLISLVQNAGEHSFTLENLLDAYKNNPTVKNIIKDIKDVSVSQNNQDPNQPKVQIAKYVYIQPRLDVEELPNMDSETEVPMGQPEKTVDAMAKSALAKRS